MNKSVFGEDAVDQNNIPRSYLPTGSSSDTCICTFCGFIHSGQVHHRTSSQTAQPCGPGSGRSSSPCRAKEESVDKSKCGGGDANKPRNAAPITRNTYGNDSGGRNYRGTDPTPRSSSCDGPDFDPTDPFNNCPDWVIDGVFYFMVVSGVVGFTALFICMRTRPMKECLLPFGRDGPCNVHPNILRHLSKSSITCERKTETKDSTSPSTSPSTGDLPKHLQEQYASFKVAANKEGCIRRFSEKCPGLMNYAGAMMGGSVMSTRDTQHFHNPMLCRCHDSGSAGKLCDPTDYSSDCLDCKCDRIQADTIIKEDDKLVPGKCWAFSGVGKVLLRTYFNLVVVGVGLHHPSKKEVLPGFYNSAPREFEVWGYNSMDDQDPFLFGKYEYKSDGFPSQMFEVKNFTPKKYNLVQFNFISNYGNKNYTAVYKVDVYGLQDDTLKD